MTLDIRSSELKHNFLKERICEVEKHFSEMNAEISCYIKTQAHVRDSGDKLAKSIVHYASKEILNQTVRTAMAEFSDILSTVQEYREAQIRRAELKVMYHLEKYNDICKQAKSNLKKCSESQLKELKKKNCLEKIRGKNPTNWQKIAEIEKEVTEAQDVANRNAIELSKQMEDFEKQKIDDIKKIFLEFIKIEMRFNCKAIELYTKAFSVVNSINVEDDLKEFQSHFKAHTSTLDTESIAPVNDDEVKANTDLSSSTPVNKMPLKASIKTFQGRPRSIFTQKSPTQRLEFSSSSFDSALESKYDFGDN